MKIIISENPVVFLYIYIYILFNKVLRGYNVEALASIQYEMTGG